MKIEKLVVRAQKGDRKAFLRLVESEQTKLYKIAFLYTKNKEDALDIVQETIYKAIDSIKSLKKSQYFSTWITKILINTALDFIKKRKNVVLFETENVERVLDKELILDERIDLYRAIDLLNERYKTFIILRYFKDLTISQIAELLEIPEGTVKSSLHRAIQMLRVTIKGECINE